MDPKDAAEEAEFQASKWKPNDKGLPGRRMPADYIMRKDPIARRAYLEMRSNLGLSHEEAELRIERLSDANFRTVLLFGAEKDDLTDEEIEDLDRRPEMWGCSSPAASPSSRYSRTSKNSG